jgi:CRISPR-associated protein Csy1
MKVNSKPPNRRTGMDELTDRAKLFRTAIADFINTRREAKLQSKEGEGSMALKYEYATWLADVASRAHNLQVVTHPIKFTHSAIKGGSSIRFRPGESVLHDEIGTHSLTGGLEEDFAISDAKHLDVHSLLSKVIVEERPLLSWILEGDADLERALHDQPSRAKEMMDSFRRVTRQDECPISHILAKQVYWLHGEIPTDDDQYHLLQPMFSSALEHEINEEICSAREAAFEALGAHKQKPTYADHHTYPDLVKRHIGGSNEQNVSPLNKTRRGDNHLLPSLPPIWKPRRTNLLKRKSALEEFIWFEDVRDQVKALVDFMESVQDKTTNMEIKNQRDALVNDLVESLTLFSLAIRAGYSPGWTCDENCRLPRCEQLWLDSERTELPLRDDPNHPEWREDDVTFRENYDGHWADEVAGRFGLWLNDQLRKRSDALMALGEVEMRHFARKVILDVAWPIPLQRNAKVDAT